MSCQVWQSTVSVSRITPSKSKIRAFIVITWFTNSRQNQRFRLDFLGVLRLQPDCFVQFDLWSSVGCGRTSPWSALIYARLSIVLFSFSCLNFWECPLWLILSVHLFIIIVTVEEIDWRRVSQFVFIDRRLASEDRSTPARRGLVVRAGTGDNSGWTESRGIRRISRCQGRWRLIGTAPSDPQNVRVDSG